jgi:purine-nucleoside phosphorylase
MDTLKGLPTMDHIREAATFLQSRGVEAPVAGIVLGTGLGRLADHITDPVVLAYEDIPHFPLSTVEFHSGKLIYGRLEDVPVVAMQGRFHPYEGYPLPWVTFPVRVLKVLGVQQLFLSNAAGGMNPAMKKGDLMLLIDHINLLPGNPLTGPNNDELGPRFPDMSAAYDRDLNARIRRAAAEEGITLQEGVYVAVSGPCLETRAEYRFLRAIGADAVGMSTVPEVIVANHMGLPCAALSVITDECDPDHLMPVNIEEIIAVAGKAEDKLITIMLNVIRAMAQ